LNTVLRDPERYVDYIDSAIQIHDALEAERQRQQSFIESKARQIERARQIMGMSRLPMPPLSPEEQPKPDIKQDNIKFKAIAGV
jgi:hypothetical protein